MPFLRPDADSVDGGWTTNAGGTVLYAAIDEETASDADFIRSGSSPSADVAAMTLSNPGGSVDTSQAVTVRYRYAKSGADAINLVTRLKQGATLIAEWEHLAIGASYVTAAQVLTSGEKSTITDWSALLFEFEANPAAAGLTLEGFTTAESTTSPVTVNKPTGTASGDLLILVAMTGSNGAASGFADNVSGFTLFENDFVASDFMDGACYWRIADGTEGATFSVGNTGADNSNWLMCLRISGAHQTTPINATTSYNSAATGSPDILPITTTVDGCLGLSFSGNDQTGFTMGTALLVDWVAETQLETTVGTRDITIKWATREIATAQTTALEEFETLLGGVQTSQETISMTFAVRPA